MDPTSWTTSHPGARPDLAWWSPGSPASWPPLWSCQPGVDSPCGSERCHPRASSWSPRGLEGKAHREELTSARWSLSLTLLPTVSPLVSFWRRPLEAETNNYRCSDPSQGGGRVESRGALEPDSLGWIPPVTSSSACFCRMVAAL